MGDRQAAVRLVEELVTKGESHEEESLRADATVIPVLIYTNVREAVAWLGEAFGFAERVRIGEKHRSQLPFSDDAQIGAWALQGVEEAVAAGYLNGFPNGKEPRVINLLRLVAAG